MMRVPVYHAFGVSRGVGTSHEVKILCNRLLVLPAGCRRILDLVVCQRLGLDLSCNCKYQLNRFWSDALP